ncbi:MAG: hypothetical protein Q8L27_01030 [archaeon]|nr:hypothetical protein [archaeon]
MKTRRLNHLNNVAILNGYKAIYQRITKQIDCYNAQRPYHEDTCKLFSTEERISVQKSNIASLQQLAESEGVSKFVVFKLRRARIQMNVCGKILVK